MQIHWISIIQGCPDDLANLKTCLTWAYLPCSYYKKTFAQCTRHTEDHRPRIQKCISRVLRGRISARTWLAKRQGHTRPCARRFFTEHRWKEQPYTFLPKCLDFITSSLFCCFVNPSYIAARFIQITNIVHVKIRILIIEMPSIETSS